MTGAPRARTRWWPAAACALVAVVLTVLVVIDWSPLQTLDRRIVESAHRQVLAHDGLRGTARFVTHLGDPLVVSALSVVLAAVLWTRGARRAAFVVVVVRLVAILLSSTVKAAVDRPRPQLDQVVAHASGAAFPSGHALGSAALWATVALVGLDRFGRRWAVAVAVVAPVLVGTTRVLLGVHWPSDVLAGLLLGWGVAVMTVALIPQRPQPVP